MVRKLFSFKIGNLDGLNTQEVLRTIDNLMEHTLDLTKENMHDEVDRAVPMETGLLRSTIHTSLDTSIYQAHRISINMGSPLLYAKYVDKMLTTQVRHSIDPEAEGFYSDYLVKEGKERLSLNWMLSKMTIGAR